MWQKYKDLDRDSSVCMYQINDTSILVMFKDGSVYCYSYNSAGKVHIEQMKKLATYGDGLCSYIHVNNVRYEWKEIKGIRKYVSC